MRCRVSIASWICVLSLFIFPAAGVAQSLQLGLIVVTVTDAGTGKPIDNAQVFLLGGDTPQSSLTNAKGVLLFENIQPALYHVEVKAAGYRDSSAVEAEVDEGQRVNVAVELAPAIRTIASVTARPSVNVTSEDIAANGPQRKVSQSLEDALGKIAGVEVEDQLYGGDSAFNISLQGADASQTGYSIDGVQVRGAASQAMGGLQDLFSGASVNFAPSAMSTAGTVNVFTAQPTKTWNYHFTGVAGNYGNTLGTWIVTGGVGKVALALEHAGGGEDFPIDGAFFADASGRAYAHDGGYSRTANLLKAAVELSPVTSFKYGVMGGNNSESDLCTDMTALLPCSYGPDAIHHGTVAMQTFSVATLAGHLAFNAFINSGNFRSTDAQPNRAVNGLLNPSYTSESYPWVGGGTYISSSARRHTVSAGIYDEVSSGSSTSAYAFTQSNSFSRTERYGDVWIEDKVKSNDKLALDYTLSEAEGTGAGYALQAYEETTWQPRKQDVITAGFGFGSADPAPTYGSPIGDPLAAQFDCYNESVFVQGPGDEATHQSSLEYDAGWRHSWNGGYVTANVYRNDYNGQSMYAGVPFAAEAASIFPDGASSYLSALRNVWSQPTVCGSIPFDPSRVYVDQSLSGLNQINQGFRVSARVPLGKTLIALPDYAVTSTYLAWLDPRLTYRGSIFRRGPSCRIVRCALRD